MDVCGYWKGARKKDGMEVIKGVYGVELWISN